MAKICPYNRGRKVQKYRQQNTLDGDGEVNGYEYPMRVKFVPEACYEERCGAWRDGACRYAAVSLENGGINLIAQGSQAGSHIKKIG